MDREIDREIPKLLKNFTFKKVLKIFEFIDNQKFEQNQYKF